MDKEKHTNVEYVEGTHAASLKIRENHFNSLEEIEEEFYEITLLKKKVRSKYFCVYSIVFDCIVLT